MRVSSPASTLIIAGSVSLPPAHVCNLHAAPLGHPEFIQLRHVPASNVSGHASRLIRAVHLRTTFYSRARLLWRGQLARIRGSRQKPSSGNKNYGYAGTYNESTTWPGSG